MAAQTISLSPNTARASHHDCRLPNSIFPPLTQFLSLKSSNCPWLGTSKLSQIGISLPKHRAINATALSSLPTAKPERVSPTEELPKWSSKAIKSFAMAELEARKLYAPETGTEALLLGILYEATNLASKFLLANGITLFKVREEATKLLGKRKLTISMERPPLTESTQRAIDWAFDKKLKSGESGEITSAHLLLGVWSEKDSAGHKIMASLGFNDEKAQQLETLISKPGIGDD